MRRMGTRIDAIRQLVGLSQNVPGPKFPRSFQVQNLQGLGVEKSQVENKACAHGMGTFWIDILKCTRFPNLDELWLEGGEFDFGNEF